MSAIQASATSHQFTDLPVEIQARILNLVPTRQYRRVSKSFLEVVIPAALTKSQQIRPEDEDLFSKKLQELTDPTTKRLAMHMGLQAIFLFSDIPQSDWDNPDTLDKKIDPEVKARVITQPTESKRDYLSKFKFTGSREDREAAFSCCTTYFVNLLPDYLTKIPPFLFENLFELLCKQPAPKIPPELFPSLKNPNLMKYLSPQIESVASTLFDKLFPEMNKLCPYHWHNTLLFYGDMEKRELRVDFTKFLGKLEKLKPEQKQVFREKISGSSTKEDKTVDLLIEEWSLLKARDKEGALQRGLDAFLRQ